MRRKTRQRASIEAVFRQAGRPLSAREVLDDAAAVTPGLGIATVYRTIHGLLDDGWLEMVALPDEPPRYELAGKHHHDHFRCRGCTRVFDVEDCPVLDARVPAGFVLEGHSAVLRGLCAACSSPARVRAHRSAVGSRLRARDGRFRQYRLPVTSTSSLPGIT
jgi:Fur family ferric uptake transcriptional regulator